MNGFQSGVTLFNLMVGAGLLVLFLPVVISAQAAQQPSAEDEPGTEELIDKIKHDSIFFTGIVMTVARYSFDDRTSPGGRGFEVATARLGIGGNLDEQFSYRIQFRLEQSPSLLDAWIQYRIHDLAVVRAGAQKPQSSAELIHSTGTTEFIDRAQLTGQLLSRDLGVSLNGSLGNLGYHAGIYNGTGLQANPDNRFLYLFRGFMERPFEEYGEIEVGFSLAYGVCREAACSPENLPADGSRTSVGADVRVEADRWLLSGELIRTEADVDALSHDRESVFGSHLTGGVLLSRATRLLVRWDHHEYREAEQLNNRFLIGLNHRFTSLIKCQLNLLADMDENRDWYRGALFNLQLRF